MSPITSAVTAVSSGFPVQNLNRLTLHPPLPQADRIGDVLKRLCTFGAKFGGSSGGPFAQTSAGACHLPPYEAFPAAQSDTIPTGRVAIAGVPHQVWRTRSLGYQAAGTPLNQFSLP